MTTAPHQTPPSAVTSAGSGWISADKLIRLRQRHLFDISYAVVAIVLTAVSIYSTYVVARAYVDDNKLTTVEVMTAGTNNSVKFLENLTIQVPFLPEIWNITVDNNRNTIRAVIPDFMRLNKSSYYLNENAKQLSPQARLDLALTSESVDSMDNRFMDSGIWSDSIGEWWGDDFFIRQPYASELMDEVLSDLLPIVFPTADSLIFDKRDYFFADHLNLDSVTLTVPVQAMFEQQNNPLNFAIMAAKNPFDSSQLIVLNRGLPVYTEFRSLGAAHPSDKKQEFMLTPLKTIYVTMRLNSANLFEKVETRSDKECSICGRMSNTEDCILKCQLDAVASQCGCLPFSFRRYFDQQQKAILPFCNNSLYAKCSNTSAYDGHLRCEASLCQPCLSIRNSYFTSTFVADSVIGSADKLGQFYLSIVIESGEYVIFREKIKDSLLDMLGKVGGNLGLFLSFSLLGIWQLFLYLYELHRNRKRKVQMNSPVASFATKWFVHSRHLEIQNGGDKIKTMEQEMMDVKLEIDELKLKMNEQNEQAQKERLDYEKRLAMTEEQMQILKSKASKKQIPLNLRMND